MCRAVACQVVVSDVHKFTLILPLWIWWRINTI